MGRRQTYPGFIDRLLAFGMNETHMDVVPETAGLRQPLSDHERLSTLGNREAAASSCLSVVISAAAAAVRSTIIASISRGRADRALPPSGLLAVAGFGRPDRITARLTNG
jgi:hypothetical protein